MTTTANQPKINIPNLSIGVIIVTCAVCFSFISSMEHQAEYTSAIVNTANSVSATLDQPTSPEITTQQVQDMFNKEGSVGVMNSMAFGDLLPTIVKVMIIVGVALAVFMMMNMTGLIPRYGGCS